MPKVIISDTSFLIIPTKIGELDLLRQRYKTVTITQDILSEYGENLPDRIEVKQVKDKYRETQCQIASLMAGRERFQG